MSPVSFGRSILDKFESIQFTFSDASGLLFSNAQIATSKTGTNINATIKENTKEAAIWPIYDQKTSCQSQSLTFYQFECPNTFTVTLNATQEVCDGTTIVLKAFKYFDPELKAIGVVDKNIPLDCKLPLFTTSYSDHFYPLAILNSVDASLHSPTVNSFILIEKYGRYSFYWSQEIKDCIIKLKPSNIFNPYTDTLPECVQSDKFEPDVVFKNTMGNYLTWTSFDDEIYAFKLIVLDSNSYCEFEQEFYLNVHGAPMRLESQVLVMSLSFLLMILMLVVFYLWYRREKVKF